MRKNLQSLGANAWRAAMVDLENNDIRDVVRAHAQQHDSREQLEAFAHAAEKGIAL